MISPVGSVANTGPADGGDESAVADFAGEEHLITIGAQFSGLQDVAATDQTPVALEPGRYTVILEPAAVLDLVGFLFYDFAATAVADKRIRNIWSK